MRLFFVIAVLILTSGCSQADLIENFTTEEERQFGEKVIRLITNDEPEELKKISHPSIAQKLDPIFADLVAQFPPSRPLKTELVSANFVEQLEMDERTTNLVYDASGKTKHALVQMRLLTKDNEILLAAVHVTPIAGPAKELNSFNFSGKSFWHYVFLVLAIAGPLVTIAAIFRLFKGPSRKYRWLWVVACLVGLTKFSIDWSTGQIGFQPIAFQLLSAAAMKPNIIGAWIISFSIPAAAIYILLKKMPIEKEDVSEEFL